MLGTARLNSPGTAATSQWLSALRQALPQGLPLPEDVWRKRHRVILALLWAYAIGIAVFGLVMGYGLGHSLAEASIVALMALLAGMRRGGRTVRSAVASLGLLTSSALLVHLSGGYIEVHFHFFVMVVVITLYQEWTPFLLAIAYVVLEHGLGGAIYPAAVYNHPDAWENPWKWAAIHGVFVLGASAAAIANWRLSEDARARTASILNVVGEGILGVDRAGRATFVNPAAVRMTGYRAGELVGQPVHQLLHHSRSDGSPFPRAQCPSGRAIANGEGFRAADDLFWRKDDPASRSRRSARRSLSATRSSARSSPSPTSASARKPRRRSGRAIDDSKPPLPSCSRLSSRWCSRSACAPSARWPVVSPTTSTTRWGPSSASANCS
jgi:PAS domain-containing protein